MSLTIHCPLWKKKQSVQISSSFSSVPTKFLLYQLYHTTSTTSSCIVPSRSNTYQWESTHHDNNTNSTSLSTTTTTSSSLTTSATSDTTSSSSSPFTSFKPIDFKQFRRGPWQTIRSKFFTYKPLQLPTLSSIPKLKHGLDRVLFNPGAHFLQDPRTYLYNFDPYLQRIVQPQDLDFNSFSPFVISSKDEKLHQLAAKHNCRFFSSTSSTTGILSHLYFILTGPKKLNLGRLTAPFAESPDTFTKFSRMPCSVYIRKVGDQYSIDADKTFDSNDHVLSLLGRSMESMLTETRKEFTHHLKKNETKALKKPIESYFFGKAGNFLLRSQLDCYDPRLPRRIFDLKTRAAFPIRMDAQNYEDYLLYHIDKSHGLMASFEREYFDMMRSAFLKYAFQVRIGQMDGIFVTYHNTARVFGFQYIPLEELDECLFGSTSMGNQVFALTLPLLEAIVEKIIHHHPTSSLLRVTFETEKSASIYIEEVINEEEPFHYRNLLVRPPKVSRIQVSTISLINNRQLNMNSEEDSPSFKLSPKDQWDLRYSLDYEPCNESIGLDYFRVRKMQATIIARARDTSKSFRILKESKLGSITPEALSELQSRDKKVYLYPRLEFPVGKHGLVADDGWHL